MSSVGLSRLSGLFKLTTLNCSECYSVGHGNLDLRQLSALQDLGFNSCNITDEDLALISQMEKVKVLNISFCRVSHRGIQYLRDMAQLRKLESVGQRKKINSIAFEALSALIELNIGTMNLEQEIRLITTLSHLIRLNRRDLSSYELTRYRTNSDSHPTQSTKHISDVKSSHLPSKNPFADIEENDERQMFINYGVVPIRWKKAVSNRNSYNKKNFLDDTNQLKKSKGFWSRVGDFWKNLISWLCRYMGFAGRQRTSWESANHSMEF